MSTGFVAGPSLFWGGILLSMTLLEIARVSPYRRTAIEWFLGGAFLGPVFVITAVSAYSYSPLWGSYGGYMFLFWLLVSTVGMIVIILTKPEEDMALRATDENSPESS